MIAVAQFFMEDRDWSPLEGVGPVRMDACQPCPYFRGASLLPRKKRWTVICNWPNNGGDIDPNPASVKPPTEVPNVFRSAFGE